MAIGEDVELLLEIVECLQRNLSPRENTRKNAAQRLILSVNNEFVNNSRTYVRARTYVCARALIIIRPRAIDRVHAHIGHTVQLL